MIPPTLGRDARRRLFRQGEPFEHEPPGRRSFAEYADIQINGQVWGVVGVPRTPPPLDVGLREIAPTLAWVGIGLLGAGAAIMAFVIFRPTRARLRSLEEAARALGEGRTGVRANMAGCLDQCEHGVTVVIYPEAVWYGGVTAADVPEIMDRHIGKGEIVERLRIPEHLLNRPAAGAE